MRTIFLCIAISLPMCVSADSYIDKAAKELQERGLTYVRVTIEYSLTDDCNLENVHVVENMQPDVITPNVVEAIVSTYIGPFPGTNDEMIQPPSADDLTRKTLAMTTRMFWWKNDQGQTHIVCRFYSDGELESARLGNRSRNQWGEDQLLEQALSKMQAETITLHFDSE